MPKADEVKIAGLIEGAVDAAGYELVRVQIVGGGKYATLQVMAERKDNVGMTVDDCAKISKEISALLEADAELADKYDLEVSSPGIDRPLVKMKDFARYQGHLAKIELKEPLEGMRRFQGEIVAVAGKKIEFNTGKGALMIAFDAIDRAKLVLTDELLKAAASGQASH